MLPSSSEPDPEGVILDSPHGIDALISVLRDRGYRVKGPVVRDGVIVTGDVASTSDLPTGWHDVHAPGHYQLTHDGDGEMFGWAVGPQSWRAEFLPPRTIVWDARREGDSIAVHQGDDHPSPLAILGARPCDRAAIDVLANVLGGPGIADPRFTSVRTSVFTVVVECAKPGANCFCSTMGCGPDAQAGFDICLTELPGRFLARSGSPKGAEILGSLDSAEASAGDRQARLELLGNASMRRRFDPRAVAESIAGAPDDPRWAQVAERCLACGNCTLVCPTCFCTSFSDTSDVMGDLTRSRRWASCFEGEHSLLHTGPVRASIKSRYRQWLGHKLSTWWDQFGESGCVGCGRCITWCPVGIDLTEEASAIGSGERT